MSFIGSSIFRSTLRPFVRYQRGGGHGHAHGEHHGPIVINNEGEPPAKSKV